MRPSLRHAPRDALARRPPLGTGLRGPDPWIARHATSRLGLCGVLRCEEGRGPLPNVSSHVEQAIAVRREGPHGRCALEAIQRQVLPWEFPLPRVRHQLAFWRELVAPDEDLASKTSPSGELPL